MSIHVIPGEDPAESEALAAGYRHQFQPASPLERFLVDTLIQADWQLRRLHRVEAQLWTHEIAEAEKSNNDLTDAVLGHVFSRSIDVFTRLQRRIEATERSYFRALAQLQRLQAGPFRAADPSQPTEPRTPSANLASFSYSASASEKDAAHHPSFLASPHSSGASQCQDDRRPRLSLRD